MATWVANLMVAQGKAMFGIMHVKKLQILSLWVQETYDNGIQLKAADFTANTYSHFYNKLVEKQENNKADVKDTLCKPGKFNPKN